MSAGKARKLAREIATACEGAGEVRLMEVCGTHTVAMFRSGVRSMLPDSLRLISGPGCPVCVTSQGYIDAACELAGRSGVTVCTYGDMVRVPGRNGSLQDRRARGAEVVVVYSARDALRYAANRPDRQVVFLAIGFEATAPATAAVLMEAKASGQENFSVLADHKRVVPAMEALLADGSAHIDGFLCPGHVSVIIGSRAYEPIAERFAKPCVIAGFEPAGMLDGLLRLLRQVRAAEAKVENAYAAAVRPEGNPVALRWIEQVFEPAPSVWRAMGVIDASGLALREQFDRFDARRRFGVEIGPDYEPPGCRCGEVIQGRLDPPDCALFGRSCTPERPVGPCMVSGEGACAAWHKYHRAERRSESTNDTN